MLYRPTARLPWDDLDAQECGADAAPDWSTQVVVGPIKRRDQHGHLTLEWQVTVHCRPTSPDRGRQLRSSPENLRTADPVRPTDGE